MGATINWQDKNGNAPLHVASTSTCVRLLIRSKANLNITNRRGDTSLVYAVQRNEMTAVRELVWSLCDLEIRDSGGKTAVEKAKEYTHWRHKRVAEYLAYKAPQEQVRARARATTRFPGAATGATRVVRSVRSLAPRSRANHAMRLVL